MVKIAVSPKAITSPEVLWIMVGIFIAAWYKSGNAPLSLKLIDPAHPEKAILYQSTKGYKLYIHDIMALVIGAILIMTNRAVLKWLGIGLFGAYILFEISEIINTEGALQYSI